MPSRASVLQSSRAGCAAACSNPTHIFRLPTAQRWLRNRASRPRPSLDIAARRWCLRSHEHRHPPIPSLVAHLLKRWPVRFHFLKSSKVVIAVRRPFRLSCVAFPPASFVRGSHEQDSLLPARASSEYRTRGGLAVTRDGRAVHRRRQAARRPDRPARPPPRRGAVVGHHGAGPLREFRPRLLPIRRCGWKPQAPTFRWKR